MAEIEELEGSQGQGVQGAGQTQAGQGQIQEGQVQTAPGTSQGGASQTAQGGERQEGPPQLPPRALRLPTVQEVTIRGHVADIKAELGTSTKIIQNANYRLTSIDKLVPQISTALAARNNPKGPVVQSLVNQTLSLIKGVDEIVSKLEDSYIPVNVTLDILQGYEVSDLFNPANYKEDIDHTRRNLRYKIDKLNTDFVIKKQEIENLQSLISMTEARIREAESASSSRNSSPTRPVVRSNADSMKPQILNYSEATVTTVAEHMRRVLDWFRICSPMDTVSSTTGATSSAPSTSSLQSSQTDLMDVRLKRTLQT